MRRSLAPSQIIRQKDAPKVSTELKKSIDGEETLTIERMPLFGFLEIPKSLSKQFKIPSGCIVTERSIALRKIKRLGGPKQFHVVRPGDYANTLVKHTGFSANEDDGDDEAEDLPTSTTNLPPFEPLVLWSHPDEPENKIEVIPQLASKLRPHQREGVQFLFECTMGLRGFDGEGCILADDMGLGKTLMSITLLWTLLNQGFLNSQASAVRKVVVVCPTSLVGNWDNEIRKWVGEHCPTFAVKGDPKRVIKTFLQHRGKGVLIVSYETQRLYSKLFENAAKQSSANNSYSNKSFAAAGRSSMSGLGTNPRKAQISGMVTIAAAVCADSSDSTVTSANVQITVPPTEQTISHNHNQNLSSTLQGHSNNGICDLLICDEAHKLKNADSGLAKSLGLLPARKRILLSGTPMQNELSEFFNMVNFCNPGVLGSSADFKRRYERPILAAREPDASDKQTAEASRLQKELSTIVNEFILKRGNILNAQHLPPKLVQFVCCRLTPLQETLYNQLLNSKEIRHAREGKQLDTLGVIRQLINICSHPKLLVDAYNAKRMSNEPVSDELAQLVDIVHKHTSKAKNNNNNNNNNSNNNNSTAASASMNCAVATSGLTRFSSLNPQKAQQMRNFSLKKGASSSGNNNGERFDPELSGKMMVLSRMMQTMRAAKQGERIVVVSNYTQTLDLIQAMCDQSGYPVLRLDGTVTATRRTKIVDEFNAPHSGAFVFLLSSKAGGCGINLIGGNRLVLFDPDWNPASDKQAAGRIWREGQKRRCFIYRFMSTGTIEEKIIQRQLSKEGLADIVDDKEQVNAISSDELRDLFSLRTDTASDTHDTLRCKRCNYVKVKEASKKGTVAAMTPAQIEGCAHFIDTYSEYLRKESAAHQKKQSEDFVLPFSDDLSALKSALESFSHASLPAYSRTLREAMLRIDTTLQQAKQYKPSSSNATEGVRGAEVGIDPRDREAEAEAEAEVAEAAMFAAYVQALPPNFSVFEEFLNRWVEAVPHLTQLGKVKKAGTIALAGEGTEEEGGAAEEKDGEEDEDEAAVEGSFVEQEGCPDDTDFNRWSHHCGVASCDDEIMQRALADDSETVSFVFGLEVNWSLLEAKEAASREENELRKEQQRLELVALNEQRRLKKERLTSKDNVDGVDGDVDIAGGQADDEHKKNSKNKNRKAIKEIKEKEKSAKRKIGKVMAEDDDEDCEEDKVGEDPGSDGGSSVSQIKSKSTSKRQKVKISKREGEVEKVKLNKRADGTGCEASAASVSAAALDLSSPCNPMPVKATATSARRQNQSQAIDPHTQIDETFRADWEYIKRCKEKGKIKSWDDFNSVLKHLKIFNNNWRIVPGSDSLSAPIWTRTPGLKIDSLCSYAEGFDYFSSESALHDFMFTQAALMGDANLLSNVRMRSAAKTERQAGEKNKEEEEEEEEESEEDEDDDEDDVVISRRKLTAAAPLRSSAPEVRRDKMEDIDFGSSSDYSDSGDMSRVKNTINKKNSTQRSSVNDVNKDSRVTGSASNMRAGTGSKKRVIADSSDDEERTKDIHKKTKNMHIEEDEEADEEEEVVVLSQYPVKATSSYKKNKKSTTIAHPTPSPSHLCDLTSPPSSTSFPLSKQKSSASKGHENCNPNCSTTPLNTTKVRAAATSAFVKKSTAASPSSDEAKSPALKSPQNMSSSQKSGNGSGCGSGEEVAVVASSEVWVCLLCTLENSATTHPKECRLCGSRRSYNKRPKRAAAASQLLSQHSF